MHSVQIYGDELDVKKQESKELLRNNLPLYSLRIFLNMSGKLKKRTCVVDSSEIKVTDKVF